VITKWRTFVATVFCSLGGFGCWVAYHTHNNDTSPRSERPVETESTRHFGSSNDSPETLPTNSQLQFTDVSKNSGVNFMYAGGPTSKACMTEQNGGGVALLDFDADGVLDIFLANGATFDQSSSPHPSPCNRLFRANGPFQFTDVTANAGIHHSNFGMGCAAGDYDNDGFVDLFLACYGQNRLWRNNGDGTYTESTEETGVGNETWATSAAFADLDADGLLDLYVVNYVNWLPEELPCNPPGHPEINVICSPMTHDGQVDLLYRNVGDGSFEEIGEDAGVAEPEEGKGLAVAIVDFNTDGCLDVYVANDACPNFLYRNLGNMKFEEVAVSQGVAFSNDGAAGASMGVAVADYDRNGHPDICVSNFSNQVNDLFVNLGATGFASANSDSGLDNVSRSPLSFGLVFRDFNLDGWPDLFVANGHIWDETPINKEFKYRMKPHLLFNRQGQRFGNVASQAGTYFASEWVGRAVAAGDMDNDGDSDLVVAHLEAAPAVLRNDSLRGGKSIRFMLVGTKSARQANGARVEVVANGETSVSFVAAGGSFQASHSPVLVVPVGEASVLKSVQVSWPGGQVSQWNGIPVGNSQPDTWMLIEGKTNPIWINP
jgi:hypothetical protein